MYTIHVCIVIGPNKLLNELFCAMFCLSSAGIQAMERSLDLTPSSTSGGPGDSEKT